mmetsp:Transcript_27288/g.37599  ORF Transcript_27288/g.37599 Transcript_27288/m.37599 type:complete len:245 (-) Transcript_27288:1545-2279(-)
MPRWMASACSVTSLMTSLRPRTLSSHSGPSLQAHLKPPTTESLISIRYATPTVRSVITLGPMLSSPKHQIFCGVAASSQPKAGCSLRILERSLTSMLGPTTSWSNSACTSSLSGMALQNRRLCLLADLLSTSGDSAVTVSQYVTTGSEMVMGAPFMKSSCRSCRQISRCSSPQPAMMCSPASVTSQRTMGSDLDSFFRPSTSLGRSAEFFTATATRTTGDTANFMVLMQQAVSQLVMVPDLTRN